MNNAQPLESKRALARRYALCVGIGKYTNLANRNLRYAVADATTVADRLASRGDFDVTLLTESTQTTKAAIEEGVEHLLSAPDRQPEDLVVIYSSCHGELSTPEDTFCLLPSDAAVQSDGGSSQIRSSASRILPGGSHEPEQVIL